MVRVGSEQAIYPLPTSAPLACTCGSSPHGTLANPRGLALVCHRGSVNAFALQLFLIILWQADEMALPCMNPGGCAQRTSWQVLLCAINVPSRIGPRWLLGRGGGGGGRAPPPPLFYHRCPAAAGAVGGGGGGGGRHGVTPSSVGVVVTIPPTLGER